MFYSKSTGGFYHTDIHGNDIPSDAVEITQNQYQELLDGQENGKLITSNEKGYPVLVEPTPIVPTYRELRASEYPSIVDQLDTIYHNGIDAWKESIKAIKDKYPKA